MFPHSYKNYSVSTRNPATPSNSAYRINSSTRNTTTTRLIPCRLLPATVPRVSKHSTRQNKAPGLPHSIPRPYSTSRLPVILPGRNNILGGRQHPRSPYSSSQASPTVPHYRILPGEIGFFPKGLSIVCPCNTKVSVFQFTYSCFKNNSTRKSILSRVLIIPCEDTVHYLQSKLS